MFFLNSGVNLSPLGDIHIAEDGSLRVAAYFFN